jgi:hypothetical protein
LDEFFEGKKGKQVGEKSRKSISFRAKASLTENIA